MWPSRAELLRQLKKEIQRDPFFAETLHAYDALPDYAESEDDDYTVMVAERMIVNVPLFGDVGAIDVYEHPLRAITPAFTIHELRSMSRAYMGESMAPRFEQAEARVQFEADRAREELVEEAVDYLDTINRISVPISSGNLNGGEE